jgi:membrane fusion protein (multidrug efflux system)
VATQTVQLRNELAGTVTHVGFQSGEVVRKGAVLLRMDTSEERARLNAQAARAAVAGKNLERSRELVKRGFISQAQIDLLVSESRAAGAEAAAIKAVIAKKEIRSPFTGRAGIHDLHPGQYLEEGTQITTLQGIDPRRYVDFTLPAQTAANLAMGGLVRVSGPGLPSEGIDARVTARDSSATNSRLVKYRVSVPVAPDALLPGSFADIAVPSGPATPMVFVPRTAVNQRPHAAYVFVLAPQPKGGFRVRQQVVRLGPVSGEEVAVVAGLKGGERIAADGAFKLRDGMLVQPTAKR